MFKQKQSTYSTGEINRLWQDDGSSGRGFIHAPLRRPYFVVDTFAGIRVSYRPSDATDKPDRWRPRLLLYRHPDSKILAGTPDGAPAPDGKRTIWNPCGALIGRTLSFDDLLDALAALNLGAIVVTHSGGTYVRVR